jgi:predicted nucleic acid-binding protein
MTFNDIPAGATVFLDANTLIYHFPNHPRYGAVCTSLVERIEQKEIQGFTSTDCLADLAHRLMTIEAMGHFNWPATGLAARLRKHHAEIPRLSLYKQATARVTQLGINVLPITEPLVVAATDFSSQYGLLTGDALIIAVMRHHGLTQLASLDDDFDRVPGVTRFALV